MNRLDRDIAPWKVYEALLVLILVITIGLLFRHLAGNLILNILDSLPGGATGINELFISSVLQTFLFLVFVYYFVVIKYKKSFKSLGFVKTKFIYWSLVGIVSGVLLYFSVIIVTLIINMLFPISMEPQQVTQIIMLAQSDWERFIPFIVTGIFAPLSEEIFFRGFLYQALRRKIGVRWGILIASLVFGFMHLDIVRMVPLTLGGIVLNILYEKSGSIYPSMIAHGVWNSIMTYSIFFLSN